MTDRQRNNAYNENGLKQMREILEIHVLSTRPDYSNVQQAAREPSAGPTAIVACFILVGVSYTSLELGPVFTGDLAIELVHSDNIGFAETIM